jgi:4-hydroxy-3-methylbut-2-enyl diphosphate reductase
MLIESVDKFDISLIDDVQNIGVTASASAPEILVQNFIQFLKKNFTIIVYEPEYIKEDINFKIPQQLKVVG